MGTIINSVWVLIAGLAFGAAAASFIILMREKRRRAAAQWSGKSNTTFVFSGNLKHTSLLDAIQFLEIGQREGVLHIYSGRRKGYLTFIKGQVVDGFYRNHIGREAIFRMLGLEEGDFHFEPKTITQPKLMTDSMMDIAFEWDARRQEGPIPDD
ncbi:MAG: DUF4388 domain-containing protein [Chitinispirillia bacterium]|nr:DUF4388 domain-containing protein [Chitinispirillia bacterium]MCL2242467.1 DUF4388 domain-containing protein [Chitinispirillia bacterium]